MGMTQHEDIGRRGDLLAGDDFGLAEKISNEVEGMDVEVEQCISLGKCPREVMQIVTDKMRFAEAFLQ